MSDKPKRRRNGKVDRLPVKYRDTVDQMLLEGMPYREIVEYLKENGHTMSQMAISTYAQKFLADVQMLNIAQENFAMMMSEMDKYPNLDTTEAILRLSSNHLFGALANKEEEEWKGMEPDKLIRETTSLIRAAAYKKRVDIQNQNDFDASLDAARTLIFETLAKDKPELYRELNTYLLELQNKDAEGGT